MSMSIRVPVLLAALAVACAGGERPPADSAMELGQRYTSWFLGGRPEQLWARFSPDLQEAFGAADSLHAYQHRMLSELGRERETDGETVDSTGEARVYTRIARFERAAEPMMLQWALASGGTITGFILRPVPKDSPAAAQ